MVQDFAVYQIQSPRGGIEKLKIKFHLEWKKRNRFEILVPSFSALYKKLKSSIFKEMVNSPDT